MRVAWCIGTASANPLTPMTFFSQTTDSSEHICTAVNTGVIVEIFAETAKINRVVKEAENILTLGLYQVRE